MINFTLKILKSITEILQRIFREEIENINSFYKYYEEANDCV